LVHALITPALAVKSSPADAVDNSRNLWHMCKFTGGARGVPIPPLFGLRGRVPLIFHDKNVKNLLPPAVKRSDLWRLKYIKTIFDPATRDYDAIPDTSVG